MPKRLLAVCAAAAALAFAVPAAPAVAVPVPSSSVRQAPAEPPAASDLVRPSGKPVTLRSAPRKLSVSYTFDGRTYTLDDFLTRSKADGFVVLDNQKIVYERYRDAGRDTRFQSWSVGKSFTSAAVGIALRERRIRSIDDPVTRYLPELKGSGYDGVSIRDLLRMSSGIEWDEKTDVPKVHLAALRGRSVKDLAARRVNGWKPGTRFEYTSMNSFVLARLVSRATGVPYHDYVEKKIWKPAGMESTASLTHDGDGDSLGYCCYYATDRDFARFGLLYMNGGKAHGRQVVPASWVRESTRPSASFNPAYGLHWWLGDGGEGDFMAAGFGGQYIYVSPGKRVVIVKSSASGSPGEGDGGLSQPADQGETLTAFRAIAAEVARTR
ncbi:serine hydrolase [Streptosporangium sp. NPDC048047]|uniref:serine hydrolase domain-containing protein n=1 Tax=Streptosporangium sp. NPDC048047 TaxID=3155748 RepID=UPI00343D9E5D